MIEAYKKMWTNYANFKGRTSRRDYWLAFLMNIIVAFVIGFITGLVEDLSFLSIIYPIAVLVPGIAIVVRRLHDINKSGWYYFMGMIPLVGGIIVLVYLCSASVNEGNQYGEQL